jgi:uncharacterized protein (TIGR03067 family)
MLKCLLLCCIFPCIRVCGSLGLANEMPTTATQAAAKMDVESFDGTWRVEHLIYGGDLREIKFRDSDWVYSFVRSKQKMSFNLEGHKLCEWTVKVDETKTPRWIDLTLIHPTQAKGVKGLIKLDGKNLTIHLGRAGADDRPQDFSPKTGVNTILYKCRRSK